MSETTNTEAAPNQGEATEQQQDTTTPPAETLGEGGKSAIVAERELTKAAKTEAAKAKAEVEDLRAKLQAFEDADLTAQERVQKERDAATARATAAEVRLAVYELAAEHGITDKGDIDTLAAIPDEEVRASLAARLAAAGASPATPKPDPSQGATGSSGPKNNADLFANFVNSQLGG